VGQFGAFLSPMIAGYLVLARPDQSYDFGNVFLFWSILALGAAIAALLLKEEPIDHAKFEIQ
jgi:ACS family glucarate transporter-like MFS transporter